MYNREELATKLYEGLDDLILGEFTASISIDHLLTPAQKHYLVTAILDIIPTSNHEKVVEFNRAFEVAQELEDETETMLSAMPRFRLLLEEVLELGYALNLTNGAMYKTYVEINDKVYRKGIEPGIVETLDALIDILYVAYGAIDVFNLNDIADEAMEEVHSSNMSKIISSEVTETKMKEIITELKENGFEPISHINSKGIIIKDIKTDKVLKPNTYKPANLKQLYKYFKSRKNGST